MNATRLAFLLLGGSAILTTVALLLTLVRLRRLEKSCQLPLSVRGGIVGPRLGGGRTPGTGSRYFNGGAEPATGPADGQEQS